MDLKRLKEELPHGAIKQIASRTNLSTSLVSLTLNGIINGPRKADIIKAASEILVDYKAKERKALCLMNKALNS